MARPKNIVPGPGRPTGPDGRRCRRLLVRLTEDEWRRLRAAATMTGRAMGDVLRTGGVPRVGLTPGEPVVLDEDAAP